jgi:hypothetical protein
MGCLPSEVQMLTQTILGFVMLGHVTAAWAIPVLAWQATYRADA